MRRLALVALLLAGGRAFAQEEEERKPQRPKNWTITFAPVRLINPVLEVDLEYRINDQLSFTVISALGKIELDTVMDRKVSVYEVGAQVGYYVIGDFERGLMLALEGIYVKLDTEMTAGERAGVGIGPLFGYKVALRMGFSFLAQAGLSYYAGEGELENNVACDRCAANLNLNVGWSF